MCKTAALRMAIGTHPHPEKIPPSAFIAPGAVVVGDVTVDEEASLWFGAVVRGDTEAVVIGPQTNVQDGCIAHGHWHPSASREDSPFGIYRSGSGGGGRCDGGRGSQPVVRRRRARRYGSGCDWAADECARRLHCAWPLAPIRIPRRFPLRHLSLRERWWWAM